MWIDISKQQVLNIKTEGVFKKKWILYNNEKWLVKYYFVTNEWIKSQKFRFFKKLQCKFHNSKLYAKISYRKKFSEVDKEIISIWIAKDMGLFTVETFAGKDKNIKCAVIKSFLLEDDSIIEFLIPKISIIETDKINDIDKDYDRMFKYFKSFPNINNEDLELIKQEYITTILYSILIANTDAHVHNINLIYNSRFKQYRFTPIFDQNHAFDFTKDIENKIIFAGYPRGTTKDILVSLFGNYKSYCKNFISKLENYNNFKNIIYKNEFKRINKEEKDNIINQINKRKDLILEYYYKE